MVRASNGGAVAAARAALRSGCAGALASGLHHARRAHGAGFCTFNGIALAALAAFDAGAKRVLVLDLDAHCGGGTDELIGRHPAVRILDIAVDAFDRYEPAPGNTLDVVASASDYLVTLESRLQALEGEHFDLCLYNAGMDPHEGCPVGGMAGIDARLLARRERRVFEWARARSLPIAFVLAGGYVGPGLDQEQLVALHRLTLHAAAGA
jgi:acetoin utilization deacetylase AcuC-like enzyme